MVCPICNAELENNARECVVCGYHLEHEEAHLPDKANGDGRICPVCGANINPEDPVCPLCGIFVEILLETENISGKIDAEALKHEEAVEQETSAGQEMSKEQAACIEQEAAARKVKSVRKIVVAILIAVFLLLIGIIVLFVLKDSIFSTGSETPAEPVSEQEQPEEEENFR